MAKNLELDIDVPAGNAVFDGIDGDVIRFHPDVRDCTQFWFYWHFRLRNAGGRSLTFQLTTEPAMCCFGPAVSEDGGLSWRWLGAQAVSGMSFRYDCPTGADDVRLSMGMPYTQIDLGRYLASLPPAAVTRGELCRSRKGRPVELLRAGCLAGRPPVRMLLTARHHSCEMMANYAIEGFLSSVIGDGKVGRWARKNLELWIVPFADKDGVEDGDSGKARRPHDHGRDYVPPHLYPETAAIANMLRSWPAGPLTLVLDLHCPHLTGEWNEQIYLVGCEEPAHAHRMRDFMKTLSSQATGPLPVTPDDMLPFGTAWNVPAGFTDGMPLSGFARQLDTVHFAASMELPYASVRGQVVTADSARAFGADLASGVVRYTTTLSA